MLNGQEFSLSFIPGIRWSQTELGIRLQLNLEASSEFNLDLDSLLDFFLNSSWSRIWSWIFRD
jgi:hypothetical protein